jgi:hypothetical protein
MISKSKVKTVTIDLKDTNNGFDRASVEAYRTACHRFGADDCGYFGEKYLEDFPRNSSSIIVQFVTLETTGNMCGVTYSYIFECWLECDDNEE